METDADPDEGAHVAARQLNSEGLELVTAPAKRIDFMRGELKTPDDFDRMGEGVVDALFSGEALTSSGSLGQS